jgi:hypothetical protein
MSSLTTKWNALQLRRSLQIQILSQGSRKPLCFILDRLARDSTTTVKLGRDIEVASVVEEVVDQRAPLLADILVGSLPGEYSVRKSCVSGFGK